MLFTVNNRLHIQYPQFRFLTKSVLSNFFLLQSQLGLSQLTKVVIDDRTSQIDRISGYLKVLGFMNISTQI